MKTIINFRIKGLMYILCFLCILATYSWLLVWSTKAIIHQMEKPLPMGEKAITEHTVDMDEEIGTEKTFKFNGNMSLTLEDEEPQSKCKKQLSLPQKRWLSARYNSNIAPIWTENNLELDYQVLDWWLTLQSSIGMDTGKLMHKLFDFGIPEKNPFYRSNKEISEKCRRCAVVGNSGNLKSSNYGKEIDSHDFIIRMNRAPTTGFENDVGSKTTHRFMYPESAIKYLPKGVSFVLTPFKPLDIKWLLSALTTGEITKTYAAVPNKVICDKSKIIVINPGFIKYIYDRWTQHNGRYPSTGMLAVIYALHECDEVELYGFGADNNGNWHHYWEELPKTLSGAFKSTGVHDSEWEKTILQHLEKNEFIKIHIPSTS
ncbi:CMP-N-acetylneuraminate-beta-galactosamide-alpha-2,3-sialyltransferase 2-like [Clavelina lepadiformis]|uniref:CMP-N-acetylneuraminate-beta-galactosamide- alpha-2,3-sialyltransferase 2-like n=1 Tax=Clavelina lepadiformis TaxID=159417 RepID=UPI004042E77B